MRERSYIGKCFGKLTIFIRKAKPPTRFSHGRFPGAHLFQIKIHTDSDPDFTYFTYFSVFSCLLLSSCFTITGRIC